MRSRSARRLVALAAVAMVASGCQYWGQAYNYDRGATTVPWFCNPTYANSVTGPGMGNVNWYAGTTRNPLSGDDCLEVATGLDEAKEYAEQYPTLGAAVDAGFISSFPFIAGMGTHHGLGTISPQLLTDPTFDRHNPIIPGSIIDDVFDPTQPEFLQYNGNGRSAVLVGMSYYVRTDTGLPPEGFPGNNDWWHHHLTLCLNPATAQAMNVNTSDSQCANLGGINVHLDDYYMLHVWLVDDMEYFGDIHAPMHPCIQGGGAIFDMGHPCHGTAGPGGQPTGGASATGAPAAIAAANSSATPAAAGSGSPLLYCPIGQMALQ